jgi:hypothetical protein
MMEELGAEGYEKFLNREGPVIKTRIHKGLRKQNTDTH